MKLGSKYSTVFRRAKRSKTIQFNIIVTVSAKNDQMKLITRAYYYHSPEQDVTATEPYKLILLDKPTRIALVYTRLLINLSSSGFVSAP